MTTAIVLHRVADYDTWRPIYDGLDDARDAAGVLHHEVLRSEDDANLVIVRHDFTDRPAAESFFASAELKQGMEAAGVDTATIQVHFADPV
jgi:quinol monooxygenase YgiN